MKQIRQIFAEAPVTVLFVVVNILVYIVLQVVGSTLDSGFMLRYGAMNPYMIIRFGQWYRLFTAIFMHFGIEHLMNNMLLLALIGHIFEQAVGSTRFAGIYLGSGLTGSFLSFSYLCLMGRDDVVAGASGAIFGIVGGMIVVILVHKGKYHGISIKRMLLMAALTLYFGFTTAGTDNVGHVGGFVSGIILTGVFYGLPMLIRNHKTKTDM